MIVVMSTLAWLMMSYVCAGKTCLPAKVTCNSQPLTVVPARLDCLPVLVGVTHKVGVSTRPPLHPPRVQAHSSLLIKLLKVLCVQGMLDSGLMRGLSAVEIVPVNAIEERVVLRDQNLKLRASDNHASCN